jgi:hypothetical protein
MNAAAFMQKLSLPATQNVLRCINGLAYYFFIWLYVKPDLLYYSIAPHGTAFPVFQTGMEFFFGFLRLPLGPVDYVSAFLSQSLAVAWLGALTATALAGGGYACILFIGRRMSGRWFDLIACIPGIIGLVLIGGYRNPIPLLTLIDVALATALLFLPVVRRGARPLRNPGNPFHGRPAIPGVIFRSPAMALAAMALTAMVVVFNHVDRDRARLIAFTCLGRWNDVIATVNRFPLKAMDAATIFDLDAALFHTGRLGSEMLEYPQPIRTVLDGALPGKSPSFSADIRFARFHYDLGAVNKAQKALYEIFSNETEHPYILDFMAEIHLVKGQAAAAEMIYRRLRRDPVYGNRAFAMLRRLAGDTARLFLENIEEKRALAPERDTGTYQFNLKQLCLDLLERNPHNRMALEYLLTICLLSGDLRLFVDYLERFGGAIAGPLPRHWAEAVAMYNDMSPPGERRFAGRVPREIVSESVAFKETFLSIKKSCMQQRLDDRAFRRRAYGGLRGRFGNTVLFLYFFQESGAVRWPR